MKKLFTTIIISISFISISPAQQPCSCCSEEHRQFDFWIGTWKVFNNDKLAGYNTIEFVQDSCVLKESWKSASTQYTGTSINFFAKSSGKWHQTWIDNQGNPLFLVGEFVNGSMVLSSEPVPDGKGNMVINKITWNANKDGSVRQHWETSADEGSTWNTAFDGTYVRME